MGMLQQDWSLIHPSPEGLSDLQKPSKSTLCLWGKFWGQTPADHTACMQPPSSPWCFVMTLDLCRGTLSPTAKEISTTWIPHSRKTCSILHKSKMLDAVRHHDQPRLPLGTKHIPRYGQTPPIRGRCLHLVDPQTAGSRAKVPYGPRR